MPYLHRITKVTFSGISFGGAEEWSTSIAVGNESADATMPTQAQADAYRDAWRSFFIRSTSKISAVYTSTLVKVSSVGTDGKSNAADTVFADFPIETKGTNGERHPAQIALVATLQSTRARGVASKGRMYLPGVFSGVGLDGKINSLDRADIAGSVAQLVRDINAFDGTPNVAMLASPGSLNADGTPRVGGSAPLSKAITSVKVGNVLDTQRRRRNALSEEYTTIAL